jgi:outer membrane protein TolC
MNIRRAGLLLLAAIGSLRGHAQDAGRMSVQDCIAYAKEHQVRYKNVKLDELITKAKNAEITGMALPSVKANGQFVHNAVIPTQVLPGDFIGQPGTTVPVKFSLNYTNQGGISANQILFDGSITVALMARKTIEKMAHLNVERSEIDLKQDVANAYFSVVIASKAIDLLRENVRNIERIETEIKGIYEQGLQERIDVDRITVQKNNMQNELTKAENLFELGQNALKYQMGMPLEQNIVLTDSLNEDMLKAGVADDAFSLDYSVRKEFQMSETNIKLQELDLKRYRFSALPTLAAFGNIGSNTATNKFNEIFNGQYYFSAYYGLNLSVPIFEGLQRVNKVKQARYNVEKAQNDLENLKLGLDLEFRQANITLKNSLKTLANSKATMDLASRVYTVTQIKYREGVGSNLEILDASSQLLVAQTNYFNSMLDAYMSRIALLRATGKL